jgi:hypothetical protein
MSGVAQGVYLVIVRSTGEGRQLILRVDPRIVFELGP